jgi:prevent-host-death family protein
MIEATFEQFSLNPENFLRQAQGERVLVTRNGKPVAMLVGLENRDEEDFALQTSPEFWQLIEERRSRSSRPLDELESSLFGVGAPPSASQASEADS